MHWQRVFWSVALLALIGSCAGVYGIYHGYIHPAMGVLVVMVLGLGVTSAHLAFLRPAPTFSLHQLLLQYILVHIVGRLGKLLSNAFQKKCSSPQLTQGRLLTDILSFTAGTEYGRDHQLGGVKSVEGFRQAHPLTDYTHYAKYVARVKAGEKNVLAPNDAVYFIETSGTTGHSKHFPISRNVAKHYIWRTGLYFLNLMHTRQPHCLLRIASIAFKVRVKHLQNGVKIGPLSGMYSKDNGSALNLSPVPSQVLNFPQERTALYIEAVFYLADPYIGSIDVIFSSLLFSFIKIIELHWETMCLSIETGHLQLPPGFGAEVDLANLDRGLNPDASRAMDLRREFEAGMQGILSRVWPRLAHISCVSTGAFATHSRLIQQIYAPGIRQLSPIHAASEGILGFRTVDRDPHAYTLAIDLTFFEFIPEAEVDSEKPKSLLVHELRLGECYEIVLTTMTGLFRYRLGDVIKVVDFYHQTPVYEFRYRIGQMLNLHFEKLSEFVFLSALEKSIRSLRQRRTTLVDYTACENVHYEVATGTSTAERYYVLFVELQPTSHLTAGEMLQFDESLKEASEVYKSFRDAGIFSPMKVIPIQTGGFLTLKQHMTRDAPSMQFKMPRVLRKPDLLQQLISERQPEPATKPEPEVIDAYDVTPEVELGQGHKNEMKSDGE